MKKIFVGMTLFLLRAGVGDLRAEKRKWLMFDGISGSLGYSSEQQKFGFWNFSGAGLFLSAYKADPYPLVGFGIRCGEAFNTVERDLVSLFPVYIYFTPFMKTGVKHVHRVLGVSHADGGWNQEKWSLTAENKKTAIPIVKWFTYFYVGGSAWAIMNNWETNRVFGRSKYLNFGLGFCLPFDFRKFDQTIGMGPFGSFWTRFMLQLESGLLLASIDRNFYAYGAADFVKENHFYISLKLSLFSWMDIR